MSYSSLASKQEIINWVIKNLKFILNIFDIEASSKAHCNLISKFVKSKEWNGIAIVHPFIREFWKINKLQIGVYWLTNQRQKMAA